MFVRTAKDDYAKLSAPDLEWADMIESKGVCNEVRGEERIEVLHLYGFKGNWNLFRAQHRLTKSTQ